MTTAAPLTDAATDEVVRTDVAALPAPAVLAAEPLDVGVAGTAAATVAAGLTWIIVAGAAKALVLTITAPAVKPIVIGAPLKAVIRLCPA